MFPSFFLAGFEGSTGFNCRREWFDQIVATGHDEAVHEDYRRVAETGIRAVREAIRWPLVDLGGGRYDFSSVEPFLEAAHRNGITVVWDLFHYGYPDGTDPWEETFSRRFSDYCQAVARFLLPRTEGMLFVTPLNEPSFMAYAAGEKGLFAPYSVGRGWDMKVALVRAAIAGINAMRGEDPAVRLVNVDPVCHVVAGADRHALDVARFNTAHVFQAWDILAGKLLPELGGSPAHLDIVGVNYYWTNQWEWPLVPDATILPLNEDDPRRIGFAEILRGVWRRYGSPILVSETAHVGDQRGRWLAEVADAAQELLREGVPLLGVCVYPALGIPEWHERDRWTLMGLWDPGEPNRYERIAHEPSLRIVREQNPLLTSLARQQSEPVPFLRQRHGGQR